MVTEAPAHYVSKADAKILRTHRTRDIHIVVGASGSGKTLYMTGKAIRVLQHQYLINNIYRDLIGTLYLPRPLKLWSNYPVEVPYCAADDGAEFPGAHNEVILRTEPLNVEKFYVFSDDMREGHVFIDELDLIADRQDWQNGGQRLLMAILRQVRKRHMSLTASIQSLAWLNPRFQFQIDTLTQCRDGSVTAWGKSNGVDPGQITFLQTKDISGHVVGYTYEECGKVFDKWFRGEAIFPYYETDHEFNPLDNMVSYSIKRRKKVIDPNAPMGIEGQVESPEQTQNDINAIKSVVEYYVGKRADKVDYLEFQLKLREHGCNMARSEVLEYLLAAHNVTSYPSCGYAKLRFNKVTNVSNYKHRGRPPKVLK